MLVVWYTCVQGVVHITDIYPRDLVYRCSRCSPYRGYLPARFGIQVFQVQSISRIFTRAIWYTGVRGVVHITYIYPRNLVYRCSRCSPYHVYLHTQFGIQVFEVLSISRIFTRVVWYTVFRGVVHITYIYTRNLVYRCSRCSPYHVYLPAQFGILVFEV